MLLPETKEREYRFKLALRMGLPIFGLILAFISSNLIHSYDNLQPSFYFESVLLLAFSIYFIFFLIYRGFDTKITDSVTKTFTREYLYQYLEKEIKKESEYTLILISIDNLDAINSHYGIKNGDKVLHNIIQFIAKFLKEKKIKNFPLGHIKAGDFVIGLKGNRLKYKTILELLCLKSDAYTVDGIEVKISSAINDTGFSKELDYLIENLFELQEKNRNRKLSTFIDEEINPNELEAYVVKAIKNRNFMFQFQSVFKNKKSVIKECFVKIKTDNQKLLHSKIYNKVLNKLGLMIDFDLLILEKNITKYTKTSQEIVAINIAPTSVRNYRFLKKTKELMLENPDAKDKIMFLLCEEEYYSNIDRYNSTIQSLRDIGIKIVIDRLGSLHSSFLYLRDLEIDVIRFDSYYTKKSNLRDNLSIIEGYNCMAHAKGVETWVKLVESLESKNILEKIGIDYIQGKYLGVLETVYESRPS